MAGRLLEGRDTLTAQLELVVELGRSGAPDRLRELLNLRGIEVGRSRLATFLPEEIPEAEATLALAPTHLVISPGPGRPESAGVSMAMIRPAFAMTAP